MARRSLRQSAADTPLARWLVEYGEARGWTSGRQAAGYLGVKQAAFSTWLRGEVEPDRDNQEQLAAATGQSPAFIADLVRRTKAQKQAAVVAPATVASVAADDIHAFIRLTAMEAAQKTAEEMVERMSRRRDRVPAGDPVVAEMVAEINAELARMTLEQVEQARHCFRAELQRHRRGEREGLQTDRSG